MAEVMSERSKHVSDRLDKVRRGNKGTTIEIETCFAV